MNELTTKVGDSRRSALSIIALVASLAAIVIALLDPFKNGGQEPTSAPTAQTPSAMAEIRKTKVLNVGFGIWAPYTQLDEGLDQPTGFAVDLITEIAKRAELEVRFHRFQWETMKPDLMRGKWDVAIEPVFVTMPRALDFGFTEPYGRFGIACAIVRKDDERFKTFADLDQPGIKISLAEGWTSSEFAQQHLTKPEFKMMAIQQDNFAQLNEVILGRADVALNDAPTVYQFAKAHPDQVKALWLDAPPSVVVGGMLTRTDDFELINFLNNSLRVLKADGTLQKLDEKWGPLAYYEEEKLSIGAGFRK